MATDRQLKTSFARYRSHEYREIRFWCYRKGEELQLFQKPTPNTDEILFTFWEINNSSWESIERECLKRFQINPRESVTNFDYEKLKLFYLRYFFRSWSFEETLYFDDDGKLDDDSWRLFASLHPVILRELAERIFDYVLTDEDSTLIQQQAHQLLSRNAKGGVANPHPLISMFCNLTDFWERFGLNYFDLKRMPLYERNGLRQIISIEKQIQAAEADNAKKSKTVKHGHFK